jgi:signal transduction histidine kinase
MPIAEIDSIERLKRINQALVSRVERSMDQQGNAFSLFQTAINLEGRVRQHTEELRGALRRLELSNTDLVSAKENAERANLSKTRFLAAASHDVLQPLNAANLSVSALAELQTTSEGKLLVGQVERALETMDDLLRTLLDISKLDAGVVRPEIGDVALQPLFQSLESDFRPIADKKGLDLRFRATDLVIRTDRSMFRRILQNVVSNALRYTEMGGVLVGARGRGERVLVNVVDTGSGIPPDQYEAVYEEFHRGANALEAETAGTGAGLGLGLAIVRRLVQALEAEISFTSRIGKGTVFRILAARSAARQPVGRTDAAPAAPRGYGLYGTRVLVVENDLAVSEAMAALLTRWSCEVRVAATRSGALARLDGGWRPDLIIADQHLDQGGLGSQTIRHVRTKTGSAVPALLVTADPSDALAVDARRSGIELMHKPVKPAELRALMAHLLA